MYIFEYMILIHCCWINYNWRGWICSQCSSKSINQYSFYYQQKQQLTQPQLK